MEDEVSQLENELNSELKARFQNLYGSSSSFDNFWNNFSKTPGLSKRTNYGFNEKPHFKFLAKTYNLKKGLGISNKALMFQNHFNIAKVASLLSFSLLVVALLSLFVFNHNKDNSNGTDSVSTSQITVATTSQTEIVASNSTSQVAIPTINTLDNNIYAALKVAQGLKLTKEVNYVSSSNGLTVTITQLYADSNKIIIAYTISGVANKFREVQPGWASLSDQNNNKANMSFVWAGGFSNGKQDFVVSFPSFKFNLKNDVVKVNLVIRNIQGYLAAEPIPTPYYNYSSVEIDHQPFTFDLEIPVNH